MVGGLLWCGVCLNVTRVAAERASFIMGFERLKGIRDILWLKLLLLFC